MGNICSYCVERNKIIRFKITSYGFKKVIVYNSSYNNKSNNNRSNKDCIS